jgi:hypothetical protein
MKRIIRLRFRLYELEVFLGKWEHKSKFLAWDYWHLYKPAVRLLVRFDKLPF